MFDLLHAPLFAHCNLLLAALMLGGAVHLILPIYSAGNLKSGFRSFWKDEHPLFGSWFADQRSAAGSWIFLIAVVLLQFFGFFLCSLARTQWPEFISGLTDLVQQIYLFFLVVKILLCTRYNGRQLTLLVPVFFILRWVFFNNHDFWIIHGILVVLAAKDIEWRKVLKACMVTAAVCMAATMLLSIAGLIPNGNVTFYSGTPSERIRYSFGYGWPNLTGAYLLGLSVMYVCWRRISNLKLPDFLLLTAATIFCDMGPDSRAASVGLLFLLLACLVLRFCSKLLDFLPLRLLVSSCPAVLFLVSYWIQAAYSADNRFLKTMNGLVSGRFSLGHEALQTIPLRIAGQNLSDSIAIDNAYLYVWLAFGPVATMLMLVAFTVLLWKLLKIKAYTEVACFITFLLHATMEPHFLWPSVNVTIWLLAGVLYLIPSSRFYSFDKLD